MAELNLVKLRTKLFMKDAFLGSVGCQIEWYEDKSISTAATNGTKLYYNKEWMEELTPDEQLGVIAHECMHVVLMHTIRAKEIPNCHRETFNIAADMCVNRELTANNFQLPEGVINCPRQYRDMTTEEIYKDLLKGNHGGGTSGYLANSPMSNDIQPTQGEQKAKVQNTINKSMIMHGRKYNLNGTAFARELLKNLDEINRPTLPWDRLLRKYVNDFIKDDWSWARPNRRVSAVYLPSLSAESGVLGDINVYIDNSGSVDDRTIANFLKEIKNIHTCMSPKNTQISFFSTEITNSYNIKETWSISTMDPDSTCGTDIRPVVEDINMKKPVVSIVFTDGKFCDRSDEIKHPVIWIIFNNDGCKLKKGKIIYMHIV